MILGLSRKTISAVCRRLPAPGATYSPLGACGLFSGVGNLMNGGGVEIRQEGKTVGNTVLRGGSMYQVIDCSGSMEDQKIV